MRSRAAECGSASESYQGGISCQLSVVSYQLSVEWFPSAVSGQRSARVGKRSSLLQCLIFCRCAGVQTCKVASVQVQDGIFRSGERAMNRTTTNNSRKSRESEFPPTEESGLQTPPTRDITIKNRGYKTLLQEIHPFPQEIHPLKNRGYKPLPQKI